MSLNEKYLFAGLPAPPVAQQIYPIVTNDEMGNVYPNFEATYAQLSNDARNVAAQYQAASTEPDNNAGTYFFTFVNVYQPSSVFLFIRKFPIS